MTQITLERVSKSYARNAHVVRDVDLDIGPGRFCVLLGPSGCGKSTLLRMVAGLETITAGEIRIDGARVNELAPARREVAMVFQNYALYPHMTVYDNMAFGLRQARMPAAEIDRRVREAGAVLQIEPLLDRQPKALSGGQRQRVAIGRAIVRQPKVFLFDEPLSNLDAALRVHMRTEIARLHREFERASALYVTHDQTEAMALADQIVLLRAGREAIEHGSIAQVGTPMQLYHAPRDRFVAGFIGSPRMNLIPARVQGVRDDAVTLQFELEGSEPVTIALPLAAPPAVGARVTFGIRPEHLAAPVPGAATLARRVRQVEHFGDCSIVYLQGEGGEDIIAKVPGGCRSAPGELASYALMPEHCHLFDAAGFAIPRRVH